MICLFAPIFSFAQDATTSAPETATASAEVSKPSYTLHSTPMNHRDFDNIRTRIAETTDEYSRIEMAKKLIAKHTLIAKEIKAILVLFESENYKLDFAKFAYDHCLDKNNYLVVNSVFNEANSVTLLDDYIQNQ